MRIRWEKRQEERSKTENEITLLQETKAEARAEKSPRGIQTGFDL